MRVQAHEFVRVASGSVVAALALFVLDGFLHRRLGAFATMRRARHWTEVGTAAKQFCEGSPDGKRALSRLLRNRRHRTIAVRALADRIRIDPELGKQFRGREAELGYLRAWVTEQLSSRNEVDRREAAEIVGTLRMRSCTELLLVTLDASVDDRTRETICRALVVVDARTATGVLLRLLETTETSWVPDLLASASTRSGSRSVAHRALQLRVSHWSQEAPLLRAVQTPAFENIPVLLSGLRSSESTTRVDALNALAMTEGLDLHEAVTDRSTVRNRLLARTITALVEQLDHRDAPVRLASLRVLQRHGAHPSRSLSERLSGMLADPDRLVRFAAAALLCDTDETRSSLQRATTSEDANVREAAHVALLLAS